ncbi:hypothetical protein LCGC14_3161640, partial [marine sediment metagenome]
SEVWAAFLSGYLDTDGDIGPRLVRWTSCNRLLLMDCQHLLAMLGIQSAVNEVRPGQLRLEVRDTVSLRACALSLKSVHSEKQTRLERLKPLVAQDGPAAADRYKFDRVTTVDRLPEQPTIGVEVERLHTHVTDGLITHNTESDAAWLSKDVWDACLADIDVESLRVRRCWGGLDLSSKKDLTALTLVFEPGDDGIWDAITFLWTPKDTLLEREDKDRAPYTQWVRDEHLIAIPGRVIDYGWVAKTIGDVLEDFDLQCIGYDPHKIEYLEAELDDQAIEVDLIPHSQGFYKPKDGIWMPKSVEELEEQLEKRGIRIQRNPVMSWCAAGAVVVMD